MIRKLFVFVILLSLISCQKMEEPTMQVRVHNNSSLDFYKLWLGIGGNNDNVAFDFLAAGETSEYKIVASEYYGYGKINITLANTMERLPTIVIPGPDQDGPVFSEDGHYTLVYEQNNGQWQVRFEKE